MDKRGLVDGERVDLVTLSTDGVERRVHNFRLVSYSFPDVRTKKPSLEPRYRYQGMMF
jgi:hypothetical protein